jgi:hypothetical protein
MSVVFDLLSKVSVLDVNPCQWCLTCCLMSVLDVNHVSGV